MSIVGKGSVSLRKKDVAEQTSGAVGFKKIVFAHKATLGDSSISLGSLVAPSAEMPTHTNPSTNDLLAANLLFFKNNLTLISSLKGVLMLDLTYTISSSSTIVFKDFTAEDGEIFIGVIDNVAKSGVNLVDARPIIATGTIAIGVTDFNVGQSFRVNQYPSTQSGDVVVFRNGMQQFRNVGNSPTGEGNYYEVQSGNGLGQIIRFNNAPISQEESILVMSNGLIAERPDGSMMAVIESLAGQLDKVIPVLSDVSGQPESYFQGAPNDQDLKTFGDTVLDQGNRLSAIETNYHRTDFINQISSIKTPLGSGQYNNIPNSFVNIPANEEWELEGLIYFSYQAVVPNYTYVFGAFYESPGTDSGTPPTPVSSNIAGFGFALLDPAPGNQSTVNIKIRVKSNTTKTYYLVSQANMSTPANARISTVITAKKVK